MIWPEVWQRLAMFAGIAYFHIVVLVVLLSLEDALIGDYLEELGR